MVDEDALALVACTLQTGLGALPAGRSLEIALPNRVSFARAASGAVMLDGALPPSCASCTLRSLWTCQARLPWRAN